MRSKFLFTAQLSSMLRFTRRALAAKTADVVIVGGGPGGYVAAIRAAQLGLKTICVEKRKTLGGTCLNVGCIPSKALLSSTHHYQFTKKHAADFGIKVTGTEMDYGAMHAQKSKAVSSLCGGIEHLFKKNKVEWVKGAASFKSADTLEVGEDTITATKGIVIATGSEPTPLPFMPFDEKVIVSSTGALDIPTPPKHMVVIGGGVIGLEMGSVWTRLGSKVTVVEYSPQICPFLDNDVAKELKTILRKEGMQFVESTKVTGIDKTGSGAVVKFDSAPDGKGKAGQLEADVVLVSVGRRAYTHGLGLEKIGVAVNERTGGIKIDPHSWATNVKGVYAIGDAVDYGPMLAHKASEEGIAVIEALVGKGGHVNYDAIPGVIYTHPEVAWVGKTEQEAKALGRPIKVGKFPYMANSRAKTVLETAGFVKVITDAETDRILGAHIVAASVLLLCTSMYLMSTFMYFYVPLGCVPLCLHLRSCARVRGYLPSGVLASLGAS